VADLKNMNILKHSEEHPEDHHEVSGCGTAKMKADAAARRRNTSVELERLLDSRPQFLPDGRGKAREKKAAAVEAALAGRPSEKELVEKNVVKEVCEETGVVVQERSRRESVNLLGTMLGKMMDEMEEKENVKENVENVARKQKPAAVIPQRSYPPIMNNTAEWKQGDK
jgi:hypothetical protein